MSLSIEERNLPKTCLSFYQETGSNGDVINYEEYGCHYDAWKRMKELKMWDIYRFIDISHWEGRRWWSGRLGSFILEYF
jgi:hypothetical protein